MRSFRLGSIRTAEHSLPRISWTSSRPFAKYSYPQLAQGRWSSSDSPSHATTDKPYYLTTPIFYVNAAPHIGHLYTMVLTDVFKRWQQLQGKQAFLCTGTDEHGMKIQRAAQKQQMDPKEFCDGNSSKFKELAALGSISNDFFIRTTDQEHKDAVEHFWLHLKYKLPEKLGLYKGSHEGWYCVSDECFYPENLVEMRLEPQTGQKIMVNTETNNEVEWIKEETWFFPLTKYKDALLKFYDENPDWISPRYRMNEVRQWVEHHLEDLSVTRPVSRLTWGISDPEDRSQTIYVWVDALINYLTKAGYGAQWQTSDQDMGLWPADMQVLGKDILRFHAVYWPALLLALNLPLPKKLLCHNHWTMSDRKMSKSLGNVVSPTFAIQRWDVDPLRYFLIRGGNVSKDMSYSNELIRKTYEKELMAGIGNLFQRIARSRVNNAWSTKEAVQEHAKGSLSKISELEDPTYTSFALCLSAAPATFKKEMDNFDPTAALRVVADLLAETNRFISETEPWTLVKSPQQRNLLNLVIFHAAEALRIGGILMQPVMPNKMARLLDGLGVGSDKRTLAYAELGTDFEYGVEAPKGSETAGERVWVTLFPPPLGRNPGEANQRTKKMQNQRLLALQALEARLGKDGAQWVDEQVSLEAPESDKAVLVPYEAHHVLTYHGWMQDPEIQEATASEPMSLEEEYENQQSWRSARDKLTFIVCAPRDVSPADSPPGAVQAGVDDSEERMRGDINFFLYPYEDEDEDDDAAAADKQGWLTGEVDVMVAARNHRGQGLGQAAVHALLVYLSRNLDGILREHATTAGGVPGRLHGLMVKIKQSNEASRALFGKIGFRQSGGVNYFGEVTMVMGWEELERREWWKGAVGDYEEVGYDGLGGQI
ncbi:hypothetical protein S40288_07345 [Stachybotrys chartarum IBT 40288]|nr:hypothetical protein S40288_07345 [Stachybotrys chartarum IBT 40288]